MDGTLIESLNVWADADRTFAESLGLHYDGSISAAMKKLNYITACEYIKNYYSLEMPIKEIADRIMEIVKHSYLHDVPLKPFVLDFIRDRYRSGVKMCIATANDKTLAVGALKNLGIYDMMQFVLTSDEAGVGKDSPEIFWSAAKMLGFSPESTVVFEDSIHAAEAALKGGFFTVGVHDKKYADEFEDMKKLVHMSVKSFEELL